MKNKVYLIMIILIILLFLLAIYSFLVGEGIIEGFFSPNEKSFFGRDDTSNDKDNPSSVSGSGGGSGSGSGRDGVGGVSDDSNQLEDGSTPRELPADLYTNKCGYYFADYDLCAGVCPDGSSCGSDGRSCYCRKN